MPILSELNPESQRIWIREQFRPHFDQGVTGTIGKFISVPEALVSFILMTCAIDWLAGFWYGEPTQGHTRDAYIGFIERYFPSGKYDAVGLYDSLRNGLVHMFTIKGRVYSLTHNQSFRHLKPIGDQINLNSEDLFADWLLAENKYFAEIETDDELLAKFVERYERDEFLWW
jgi:hypothetical protein